MNHLPVVFGYNINATGNASVPYALCKYWNKANLASVLYGPSCEKSLADRWIRPAMGPLAKKLVYRFGEPEKPRKLVEKLALEREASNPFVYLWAGLSLDVFAGFKGQGKKIILERINCHQATSRRILDAAFQRLNLEPDHTITDVSIREENEKLEMADAIFCPNPQVFSSMLENGVDREKLIASSYGWSPDRFVSRNPAPCRNSRPVFLFVGTLCVRKGVPLLLAAWDKAEIDGSLVFCGNMDSTIKNNFGHYFERTDITHVPFTDDLGGYYNRADCFVFPSLEEGGPMVTYEAMGHGLLPLVSEMGGGAIVEHRQNGLVLDHDVDTWSTAMTAVAENIGRREELAAKALNSAMSFTWEKVAGKRAESLRNRFPGLW
jgi:glycosyltransferase involved in cell wall biosynthesis